MILCVEGLSDGRSGALRSLELAITFVGNLLQQSARHLARHGVADFAVYPVEGLDIPLAGYAETRFAVFPVAAEKDR